MSFGGAMCNTQQGINLLLKNHTPGVFRRNILDTPRGANLSGYDLFSDS
jgi:hypothetical protein